MRRPVELASLLTLAALMAAASAGCRRPPSVSVDAVEEEARQLATVIHVADPRATAQLLNGFHEVEQNAWRWTMRSFAVALRPPAGGAEKGAVLRLKLTVPEPVTKQLRSITLSANAAGAPLEPETFTKPGEHVYIRPVPAEVLAADAVTVEFALDKALPPGEVDRRELGVVVTTVGLEAR